MLGRSHIAKEGCTVHGCYSSTDGSCDVIIARSNVGYQRTEDIEGSAHTDALLYLHVCGYLIQGHMTGTFHHDLYIMIPGTFGQFSQTDKLLDLTYIRCIGQTARTAGITERDGDIVFLTDVQNLVEMFIEGIFLTGHAHPGEDKASATADNVHFSFVFLDLFNGFACDAAVQGNKIHAILRMKTDHIDKILGGQSSQIPLIVDHTVIDGNGSDHGRTFMCQLLTERLGVSMAGKIHDGLCTKLYSTHDLLHFDVVIFTVTGNAKVYIDLGAEHASHAFRVQADMIFVCTDGNFSFGDKLHKSFCRHVFFLCDNFKFRCQDAFSGSIHLGCVISHACFASFMI